MLAPGSGVKMPSWKQSNVYQIGVGVTNTHAATRLAALRAPLVHSKP